MSCENDSVQVAVRIRPLIENERARGCRSILEVFPEVKQIRIKDSDKAFTYNYVFDDNTTQDYVYNSCVKQMIDNLFKGYNMTILAYGQTGSGKTHSMGTAYNGEGEMGIIPRAINDIFNYVNDNFTYDFSITVSFVELYQETFYDLLAFKPREECVIEMRDDGKNILMPGLTEHPVQSTIKTLECLSKGSQGRATGATNMNSQSSRSHAIFTINICMQKKDDSNVNKMAKFHLVDLAGSERPKKTGATGQTFREGVNINKGLFVLGNVISALADEKQQGYICYRDSNLTRLLKDSLGGNSITLMIACISPADYNLEESLSTLRYADRARKIKNKPVINQDPKTAEINRLKKLVDQLKLELIGQGGPIICQAELEQLKRENVMLKNKNSELMLQLSSTLNEHANICERFMLVQSANENMCKKLLEIKEEYNITLNNLNTSVEQSDSAAMKAHISKLQAMDDLFTDINTEQQKVENEIRTQERSQNTINIVNTSLVSECEFNEKQEVHTKEQIAMNMELQKVTKMLALKEHLVQQILANTCHMADVTSVAANEEKIVCLEKEKDELLHQLKSTQSQGANSKIAEQRRKQIQALEKEIQDLRKKINEQGRLIKLKEKDEQKIKQLNGEILQMKNVKVKLIKNMKQESEKFRSWKLQHERDMQKLKNKDRKLQNQIVKMETMHNRQQNVLKRKMEETAAINKRLKDALALRKAVQEQKNSGKIEKISTWAQHEMELYVNIIDAEATVASMIEDRAALTLQLKDLQNDPESKNSEIAKQIEDNIEMQSVQISELQQKILDSDHVTENREKSRWDNIQTMAEAKQVCKTLFEVTGNIRRKEICNEIKIANLEANQSEIMQKTSQLENEMIHIQMKHQQEISLLENKSEEKVSLLLRQLCSVPIEGTNQDFQAQFNIQQEMLETKETEIDRLKKENEEMKEKMNEINNIELSTNEAAMKKLQKKKGQNVTFLTAPNWEDSDGNNSIGDDITADPDWKKTPLAKRVQKMRNISVPLHIGDRLTVKRRSDGSCACRGNCSKRSCGCKKLAKSCNIECKCSEDICINRSNDKENEDDSQKETTEDDDSFKSSLTSENKTISKRSRKTKNLFNQMSF